MTDTTDVSREKTPTVLSQTALAAVLYVVDADVVVAYIVVTLQIQLEYQAQCEGTWRIQVGSVGQVVVGVVLVGKVGAKKIARVSVDFQHH